MTRDEYLALLRKALSTEHGVALEIGNFYEAERPNGHHMVIIADERPRPAQRSPADSITED